VPCRMRAVPREDSVAMGGLDGQEKQTDASSCENRLRHRQGGRKAHQVVKAGKLAKKELADISKQVDALKRQLQTATKAFEAGH